MNLDDPEHIIWLYQVALDRANKVKNISQLKLNLRIYLHTKCFQ